ncbi:hypothetical protein P8C59_007816 [Phyllachora maydis]|uniref:Glutaredoxin-like protein n=1 Tax=Phyllachora maydis TaxID=1825666 RepID=A0AAD9IAG1_9PEZI|nr:hypothetical protein P8C59_007816 [Phyllachora maydis]
MRATSRLYQACRITLFTRQNCQLCSQARTVLSVVWDTRPFALKEIDIMKPENKGWKMYEFDVPVIHISKAQAPEEDPVRSSNAAKLMHRFAPEEVHAKMDSVEKT